MDDTFCFLSNSSVEEVEKHLNSVSPAIQFTVEQETDNQLPFLDVIVMRDEDETLKTSVQKENPHRQISPLPLLPWNAGQSQLSENSDEEST